MVSVLLTVIPVFLVLGAGYVSVRLGWLKAEMSDFLNAYAVRLAVPLLLFRAMYGLDFSSAFHLPMLAGFYAGALTSFLAGILLARLVWLRRPGEAVAVGFCAMFSNTVLLGVPIISRAYGEAVLTPAFGIIALHAPCLYAVGMLTMELSRRGGRTLSQALTAAAKSILANPLMIGIVSGAVLNLAGRPLPEFATAAIGMIADSAIPVALVGMGAALTRYAVRAEIAESVMVSSLSLFLHPLIALFLTHYVMDLPHEYVRAAVVIAAMPPGMNVYIFALLYNRAVALSASAVLIATTISMATISLWLLVLEAILA
ncbi:MAG: AEC family transporter [Nitratireductor sp.]|nr:AEC family transporter [Nitratireductor sp.]